MAFLLGGCAALLEPAPDPVEEPEEVQLRRSADQAWQKDRQQEAVELYQELLELPDIPEDVQIRAWQRIAKAALDMEQYALTAEALQNWADIDPGAYQEWSWNRLLLDYLKEQGRYADLQQRLENLLDRDDYGEKNQLNALLRLSRHYVQQEKYDQLWEPWQKAYYQLEKEQDRGQMEQALHEFLQGLEQQKLLSLEPEIMELDRAEFPGALAQWELYVQGLEMEHWPWSKVLRTLQEILAASQLELETELKLRLQDLKDELGPVRSGVAMLLPLDEDYQQISQGILRGVDTALWRLSHGEEVPEFRVINTATAQWKQELIGLPEYFRIVGGPLRSEIWEELADSDQVHKRTFFGFRPELPQGDEGQLAYRFFPSAQDQVQSLLDVLDQELDINNFAVLYPDGDYGDRMSQVFWQEVQDREGKISAITNYPSREHSRWREVVADFLQVPEGLRGPGRDAGQDRSGPVSRKSQFKAVFLPDSLSQARMMIPEFFYYDARSLIFLGPALWSQGWEDPSRLDQDFFQLALMPGAWWPEQENVLIQEHKQGLEELLQGDADFWTVLGFDFLRFAHSLPRELDLQDRSGLNAFLAEKEDFQWTMAPLSWDDQGRASQEMYVLQPGGDQPKPLELLSFKARWERERAQELRRRSRIIEQDGQQQ